MYVCVCVYINLNKEERFEELGEMVTKNNENKLQRMVSVQEKRKKKPAEKQHLEEQIRKFVGISVGAREGKRSRWGGD